MSRSNENRGGGREGQAPERPVKKTVRRGSVPQPAGRSPESSVNTITRRSEKAVRPTATIVQDTTRNLQSEYPGDRLDSPIQKQLGNDKSPHRLDQSPQAPSRRDAPRVRSVKSSEERPLEANPLLDEASSLLALGGFLLGSDKPNNLERLRTEIHDAVLRYLQSIQDHYDADTQNAAGFCICAFIDDCVLRTLWGQESPWRESSILATLYGTAQRHNLAHQIEKDIREGADPDLLALYHTVFSMGYQGMSDNNKVVRLREEIYRQIRFAGHDESLPLVSGWMIQAQAGEPLARRLPWWTVLAGAMAMSLLVYWILWGLLQPSVENFHDAIADNDAFKHEQLGPKDFFIESQPVQEIQKPVDIRQLLVDQDVSEDAFRLVAADAGTRIVLLSDGMFGSGSANLNKNFVPVLRSIGSALTGTTGPIIVEGHTDNVPFAGGLRSNRTLSEDRSNVVGNVLAKELGGDERLSTVGRADSSPIVCNDSSENRQRNRRVELVLPEIETFSAEHRPPPVCEETS